MVCRQARLARARQGDSMTTARALLVTAIVAVAAPAHGRICGRWNALLVSASGRVATLRLAIRRCRQFAPDEPPGCLGRYRCDGDACPSRRGRFQSDESYTSAGAWTLLHGNLLPLRKRIHPACDVLHLEAGSIGPSYRYYCFAPGPAPAPHPVIDQGTFRCQTEVACGPYACS
jgi:hypothetical protein